MPGHYICHVRFDPSGSHIEAVKVHSDGRWPPEDTAEQWSRQKVVHAIEDGCTFETMYVLASGHYLRGATVQIVHVEGRKFIKTKADRTPRDNLDNLPVF